jgi:hypothetical protein
MQLLHAGHSSVRVVVASQLPGAAALADNTWQLPNTGAAAAAAVPRSPEADDAADPPADACLPVQLKLSDLEKLQQQQQEHDIALSVVILGGCVPDAAAHSTAPAGTDTADAAAIPSAAAASARAADGISSHVAPTAVLAKLPLLVLPPAAAAELQALYTGLTAEQGLPPAAAYQELLPLLQDLAVVLSSNLLLSSNSTSSEEHGAGSAGAMRHDGDAQGMVQLLVDALLQCCEQQGLIECSKLVVGCAGITAHAAVAPADKESAETRSQAVAEATAAACDGDAHCTATVASSLGSARVQGTDNSSSSSASMKAAKLAGSSSSSGSSSKAKYSQEALAPAAGQQQQQQPSSGQHATAPGALTAGLATLLWGFPAAAEPAYQSFKAAALRNTDFLSMLSYGVGLTATVVKVMSSVTDSSTLRFLTLQAAFLFIHAVTHVAVWAAGTGVHRLVALQQWRNALLAGSATLAICLIGATSVRGGVWAAANLANQLGDKLSVYWWVFVVYRHVMQPLRLRIGVLPSLLLAVEYISLDSLYMRPQLPWLGAAGTALLAVAVHLVIVARLEFGMRRSFVRSL